ncbi:MAG TPA: glycosyltransferase [Stellaceae bacterium]|nr:glycosyltransferase [Stellaceae bacterium]
MKKSPPAIARLPEDPQRRLRVLVFTTVFPNREQPLHGTFVVERVRHAAKLADIHVIAPIPWHRVVRGLPPRREVAAGLPVSHPVLWYPPKILGSLRGLFMFLSTFREIVRLRATFDFDLIDAHFAYPDGWAAVLLGRWFHRPVCITLRGTIEQWSRRPLGRFLCDWAMRRAARVIAVAESLAERARQGGIPPQRIAVIANGIDTDRFHPLDASEARRRVGWRTDGRLLVSVGHVSPRKGFHRVIRALPRILKSFPDAYVTIVGGRGAEEDNSAELRALAQRLGLADRVAFIGAKPPDDVALWLAAADLFILASDFEGCPNVVLEAMACGRPLVATKVGDIERMVPSFAGVLFDDPEDEAALADCVVAALGRKWDDTRIRNHVAARSWDDVAEAVAAQWQLAVNPKPAVILADQPLPVRPASARPIVTGPPSLPENPS